MVAVVLAQVLGFQHRLDRRPHDSERRFQFMGCIRTEPNRLPVTAFQSVECAVQCDRVTLHFVGYRRHRKALLDVVGGDALCGISHFLQRLHRKTRKSPPAIPSESQSDR